MVIALIVVLGLQLLISSGVLLLALFLTGEELDQSDFLKCLSITLAAMILTFVPVVGFISIFVWVAAVMSVFEKTWLEALVIGIVCAVISAVVGLGLNVLASVIVGFAA